MEVWRISRWLPALTVPVGVLGLLLIGGTASSDLPWHVAIWWQLVGGVGVITAVLGVLDRVRVRASVGDGTLRYRPITGSQRSVRLRDVTAVALVPARPLDRRTLLLLHDRAGGALAFPAWAAWRRGDALRSRLLAELTGAGVAVPPDAVRALGG